MGGQSFFPDFLLIKFRCCFGPRNSPGSLKEKMESSGLQVEDYDLINGVEFDSADDFVWGQIIGKLEAGHLRHLLPRHLVAVLPKLGKCRADRRCFAELTVLAGMGLHI